MNTKLPSQSGQHPVGVVLLTPQRKQAEQQVAHSVTFETESLAFGQYEWQVYKS